MTRMQEMSFNYHFKVEQEVGSFTYAFFCFNSESPYVCWKLLFYGPSQFKDYECRMIILD
ncbi:putative mannan synthase 11 isoform X1 [Iris pallida]|uniref:Mannan synthase 11 isoform X1 n=1 Tax=Iris pallida TaxID=29817 RepID=A0AAX6FM64_IRIPA|nr:putative mannan synthase 11 isoform X1 [Iris pallida]